MSKEETVGPPSSVSFHEDVSNSGKSSKNWGMLRNVVTTSTLHEDVSNSGSVSSKNWNKLRNAVSFSELNEMVNPPAPGSATGSGMNSSSVRPGMEKMATKHHLNHTPVFSNVRATSETEKIKNKEMTDVNTPKFILYPWNKYNKMWWSITTAAAVATVLNEPFGIAFTPVGDVTAPTSIIEYCLLSIFIVDIFVQFNTAFYNSDDHIVTDRKAIAYNYIRYGNFKIDIIGVFPFYIIALACAGLIGEDTKTALVLSLFRLTRLVRLYRVKHLFDAISYSSKISLLTLTLIRNLGFAISWSHFSACTMFFISRLYNDKENTWIGDTTGQTTIQLYLTSFYWSMTTFATVGYGDWSAVNSAEQVWASLYMLINIVAQAWIIGSITLLVVKNDEKRGQYREALSKLGQFSAMHGFDRDFYKRLKTALKLSFESVDVQDEEILMHFPSSVRRRILRRLYMPCLLETSLMKDVRQQFVDEFVSACTVEVFSPNEEILQRGMNSPDLHLLVSGNVEILSARNSSVDDESTLIGGTSVGESEYMSSGLRVSGKLYPGEFINEISFFTESLQTNTIKTCNVVQVLTISRAAYKAICNDHPCSAGIVLQNLLKKVQDRLIAGGEKSVYLAKPLAVMRAGSFVDQTQKDNDVEDTDYVGADEDEDEDGEQAITKIHNKAAFGSILELVKMHIEKLRDDLTTRLLFAASRGDVATVSLMCDQGFDPNSADYDNRSALMVASMKGQTQVVQKLIEEYKADVSLLDVNGGSALYEAAQHGHDDTMDVLIRNHATLGMTENLAASTLCQLVFDGDAITLRRLLRANINVNAADYDRRTAAHIAAAEGNLVAFKILVEFGCDLNAKDRWNNSIEDEAKRALNGSKLLEFLKEVQQKKKIIGVFEKMGSKKETPTQSTDM